MRTGRFYSLRCLLAGCFWSLAVLGVLSGAGLLRLMPWLLSDEVPLAVARPFARSLAKSALETSVFLGMPFGIALAAAAALRGSDGHPSSGRFRAFPELVRGVASAALIGAALSAGGAFVLLRGSADSPGRFAGDLIEAGRRKCASAPPPSSAWVPVLGLSWLCRPDREPLLVGALPGSGQGVWFSARSLRPSDDVRRFEVDDLRVVFPAVPEGPSVRVHVGSGRLVGLSGWGRPAVLGAVPRALLVALHIVLSALGAALVIVAGRRVGRGVAAFVGGSAVLLPFLALRYLGGHDLAGRYLGGVEAGLFVLVPCAGVVGALLADGLLRLFGALALGFGGRFAGRKSE